MKQNVKKTRRLAAGAGILALSLAGLAGLTVPTPAQAAPTTYRKPVAQPLADPGVAQVGQRWVVLSTGSWKSLHVGIARAAGGPYSVTSRRLLTHRPAWMSTSDNSVWAPSIIESSPGHFAVYYAGVVKGTKGRRCIGSATGTTLAKPFKPSSRPIACWTGSGTRPADSIGNEGHAISLIDPTPAWVAGQFVLTYKTQYKAKGSNSWHTTTRLVAVDPAHPGRTAANPVHHGGGSVQISDSRSKYIEENPVLVRHGSRYTLFTSFGWFGTCNYSTRYRQNNDLWTGWLGKKPRTLEFDQKPKTCGTGNAQVIADSAGTWRIFFNGHLDHTASPAAQHNPRGPQGMYVATVAWQHGRPRVTTFAR